MKPTPGENFSAIVRVLEEPKKTNVGERKLVVVKVSDGENIINLVAWDREAESWDLSKNDLVELRDCFCPKSISGSQPPTIEVMPQTKIKKISLVFPSVEECMRNRFIAEVGDFEYVITEGFIVEVYSTVSFFCEECGVSSGVVCECGLPSSQIFRIEGIFSDGTRAMDFVTVSERVSEELSQRTKAEAVSLNPHDLMREPHKIMGYIRDNRLYLEEVLG